MVKSCSLLILALATFFSPACQLDAEARRHTLSTFTAPSTPPAPVLAPATATSPPTPTDTPLPAPLLTARLDQALRAFQAGDYLSAAAGFDALLADPGANPDEQRQALYWRGRCELALGDSTAAIDTFRQFGQQYPSDPLLRAAQFNLGRAYEASGRTPEAVDAYRAALRPESPINVYLHEIMGDALFRSGASDEAIAAYQAGLNSTGDPSFQVHLRESMAQTELARHNYAAAVEQYQTILNLAQIEAYRAKILKVLGDTYAAAGDRDSARQRYLEAVNNYPTVYDSYLALVELVVNDSVPVDEFQRGLVNYHAGSYGAAIAAFERYLLPTDGASAEGGVSPEFEGAVGDNAQNSDTPELKPIEPLTGTLVLTMAAESWPEPVEAAGPEPPANPAVATTAPARAGEALWLLGNSYQGLGMADSAVLVFNRLINEYPNSQHWGEAHVQAGQALANAANHAQATTVWREFAAAQPSHPLADEALWRVSRLNWNLENFAVARQDFLELAAKYPGSRYAGDSLYWAGQSAYKTENYEAAVSDWAKLAELYPDSSLVSYAGYWRAKTLTALGRGDEATALLSELANGPTDYYRLRARDLLTGQHPHSVPLSLPSPAQLAQEQAEAEAWLRSWRPSEAASLSALSPAILNHPAFQRGDTLFELGLRDQALIEFETVKDDLGDDPLALYPLAIYFRDRQMGRLSILTAARLATLSPAKAVDGAPTFIQRLNYPFMFDDVIFAEAERLSLDPALVVSLIRQESLFEFSAESVAGARGLMQVMPGTGEYVATKSDFGPFDSTQLWLPYVSIKFGAWYIDQQLGLFDDNQFAAMAAYNAGPGNVIEWLKVSEDLDIFVESIPFWESRTYIRKIYENLAAYRRLYGSATEQSP